MQEENIGNVSFVSVAEFKYLETNVMTRNWGQKEIKIKMK